MPTSYYSSGEIRKYREINNRGEYHGRYIKYARTGEIIRYYNYQNGVKEGDFMIVVDDVSHHGQFVADKLHGDYRIFSKLNGRLITYSYYNAGVLCGIYERYDAETGRLSMRAFIRNGGLHGVKDRFNKMGDLVVSENYSNNKFVKNLKF
jgi:antitoxin component YwqK of YwqJK toxin-antitoxin module